MFEVLSFVGPLRKGGEGAFMENVAHVPDKRSGRNPYGGHLRVHKVDHTELLTLQSEAS